MSPPERATDAIVRLLRQAGAAEPTAGQVIVSGNGNILGDVTINHPSPAPGRSSRRTRRISAINYIRSSCRCAGDPTAWIEFTRIEFGAADLDQLSDLELERVRGWCAAREGRAR